MKYVAFYDVPELKPENRYVNAAARGVIEYMIQVFSAIEPVEVISPGRTLNSNGFYRGKTYRISDSAVIKVPFTFGVNNNLGRIFSLIWTQVWLFTYLFFHTKRGEKIVFYHSLSLMSIISLLARLKGIKPILEFREIYSDINSVSNRLEKKEHTYYRCAYGFIFPSDAIRRLLQINDKPYVLAPGSYDIHTGVTQKFNDGKIHAVYAGNLRKDKGGAYLAIDAAEYLTDKYEVHILCGSYSEKSLNEYKKEVAIIENKTKCRIVFEGAKFGEEFYSFLGKCQIGLATQYDGDFSNSSFPSKILTYLGCGLTVIVPPIDAVRLSPVYEYVREYKDFNPESVAKTIMEAGQDETDVQSGLQNLHNKLVNSLKSIINNFPE